MLVEIYSHLGGLYCRSIDKAAPKTIESVSGVIERVTFFSEESGFAVLKVKARGRRDLVTVIGSLPSVTPGEWLTAEGYWVHNKEHGMELRADKLRSVPPTTREGIERYLGSGMVKGIGPKYAKKLVEKFGEAIFDIIENYSGRLEEVEGIGPGRRRKIKEAWAEQKIIREIMVFLHSHGVSAARAVRIFKTYGERAIERVRQNPYLLARDIPGIGFKTADEIAQKVGIPRDSIMRASAGLEFVLSQAAGYGHCALPRELLLEEAEKVLSLPRTLIAEALLRLLQKRELVHESIQEEDLIFLPGLRSSEEGIAAALTDLCRKPPSYPAIDLARAIEWAQKKTGKQLGESQRAAVASAFAHRALVITGGPGVGKTTLLNTILMIVRAKKAKCLLCAPTGRAAKRLSESTGMDAFTIHRLLEVQPNRGFARDAARPLEGDLLVVDEMSMVDVPLMNALLRAHPPNANLILVGDVDQLPSVGPGSVLRDLIESGVLPVVRLTEVFRQAAGSHIITNAHLVNRGVFPDSASGDSTDFYFVQRETPEAILSTLEDLVKNRIPRKFGFDPRRDIQLLSPMNRGSLGVREMNLLLQRELNPKREGEIAVQKFGWEFRVGDKVIQTENNYDKEVFNGDIGHITAIDPVEKEVRIDFEGHQAMYEYGELDEIALAYAITVHKSQGSEFPVVVIPMATQQFLLLQRNLIYTGITRGKKLVVLIGQRKALQMAIRNNTTSRRYGGLLARLRAAATQSG
jgi:exodeoxyribonuclease V alpha subunit